MEIKKVSFTSDGVQQLSSEWYGINWPVVYLLSNKKDIYIGETTSIRTRLNQHYKDEKKQDFKDVGNVGVISNETFNKSAILDIESKLIEYMSADNKFDITNGNSGMRNHNFYEKPLYEAHFRTIWKKLQALDYVKQDLDVLINSDLFKYTPYKMLTEDQYDAVLNIVLDILISIQAGVSTTTIVNGEAGTGKTVLAMYILKLFTDNEVLNLVAKEDESYLEKFENIEEKLREFKVAIVVPMTALRGTLKEVVKQVKGLKASMIIGPNDVVKDNYDLLLVDESHRLYRRTAITNYGSFDNVNRMLKFDKEATQLDWIIESAEHVILFYDRNQSVRPSDVRPEDFDNLIKLGDLSTYNLKSQLRVIGGEDYISYIKSLMYSKPPLQKRRFDDYDLKLFNSISELRNTILEKNEEYGLSRMLSGYAWPWKTKGKTYQEITEKGLYDIEVDDERLVWNTSLKAWVLSENAINEVGSIHTIQGYDLNYTGVIIGTDIKYDPELKTIVVDKDSYFDSKGKQSVSDEEELLEYILNIYSVLLTRGIRGTYLYVCDPHLRNYLSKYIDVVA